MVSRRDQIEDMVARRTHEIFESRGRADGHDFDDWVQAELELLHPCRHSLKQSEEELIFNAELPGTFTADQLNVSLEPRRLILSGERKLSVTCGGDVPAHTEKRTQQIFQVEDLPVEVDPSRANVRLNGELLEVRMPKVATP
jgi:HSP20 family molecular chaperone IbpA